MKAMKRLYLANTDDSDLLKIPDVYKKNDKFIFDIDAHPDLSPRSK
jgi:hypothetical protein